MRSPAPPAPRDPSRRFLLILTVLALATRLAWVLLIHPPWAYVFSDMAGYLHRAQRLATEGFVFGDRTLAWQVYGTHVLMALPLAIFGAKNLVAPAVVQALLGAAAVPLAYLLALRTIPRRPLPKIVGIVALLWYPHLSHTGYFLSEPYFLCFQLASTLGLVRLAQEGRGALATGIVSALALMVRPQSALFFLGSFVVFLVARTSMPRVRWRHVCVVAACLLFVLVVSLVRFRLHTGYFGGIAENANMNLTAGRCHNIVTQAFPDRAALARSNARGSTRDGRRVSLPGFRALARRFPDDHPLALRPALGTESLKFVGYIGDPRIHRRLRRACYARTGWLEQARYSLVNVALLWFVSPPWPEAERGRRWFQPPALAYRAIYQWFVWLPSLVGLVAALVRTRRNPALALVALQIVTSIATAAIFFGSQRLRAPYDTYAIILAVWVYARAFDAIRRRYARRRTLVAGAAALLCVALAAAPVAEAHDCAVVAEADRAPNAAPPQRPRDARPLGVRDGVALFALPAPAPGTVAFLAETEVAAPLARIARLLRDGDRHVGWFHQAVETRVLRRRRGGFDVYYVLASPPPVRDRDAVLRVRERSFRGGCSFVFAAVPDPSVPVVGGRVRMPRLEGRFDLVARGPGRTLVRFRVVADPGGRLPAAMAARGIREIPHRSLVALRRLAEAGDAAP